MGRHEISGLFVSFCDREPLDLVRLIPADWFEKKLLLLLLLLLPTVFDDNAELRAKFRSGAVKRRANVGENALLNPAALAFADDIPVVTVDDPFSFEL